MDMLDGPQCGLRILLALVWGLHWRCSLAATGYGWGSPLRNRHLFGRHLSPCKLSFWILGSPLGLKPLLVCIHRYGEHEVGLNVPVQTGRRPERYRHLGSLRHAVRKLLRHILQHGCGGIPSEVREGDLMNRLLPRWLVPHSMEPETPKPKRSQWFSSFLYDLLA